MAVERYRPPLTAQEIADEKARQEKFRRESEELRKKRVERRAARVTSLAAQLAISVVGDPNLPRSIQDRLTEASVEKPEQRSQVTDLLSPEETAVLPDMQFVVEGILDIAAHDAGVAAVQANRRANSVIGRRAR